MALDLAAKSLEVYVASVHLNHVEENAAREVYLSDRPGTKAFRWYLESRAYDRFDLLLHPRFFSLLAHSLVAEHAEHCIRKLLYTKDTPARVASVERYPDQWKGMVLRALVHARMFWSHESKAFAKGNATYYRAIKGGEQRNERPGKYVNLSPAAKLLAKFATRTHPRISIPNRWICSSIRFPGGAERMRQKAITF